MAKPSKYSVLLCLLVALFLCTSCEDEPVDLGGVSIDTKYLWLGPESVMYPLTVRSGEPWTVSSIPEWMKVADLSGTEYEWQLSLWVEANEEYTRSGELVLKSESSTAILKVNQDGAKIPVSWISLNKTKLNLVLGARDRLTVTVGPSDATDKDMCWVSSDTSVAVVSPDGLVTATKREGEAQITVSTLKGDFSASCQVMVMQAAAVDLGLSVKWASCNLGASRPEEYGDYYAWGEISPKEEYAWSNYKWCYGAYDRLSKYNNNSIFGVVDDKLQLDLSDDAARANWGGAWRLPTNAEATELKTQCRWEWVWTTDDGMGGYKVTSLTNGNSIFLPAAGYRMDDILEGAESFGYYSSSTLDTDEPINALGLFFHWWSGVFDKDGRCFGFSIRPVRE